MTKKRIKDLQHLLKKNNLDAFLSFNPIDIFYLTNQLVSSGKVLITKKHAYLLLDGRYFNQAKKKSPIPVILDSANAFKQIFKRKIFQDIHVIGVDEKTDVKTFLSLKKNLSPVKIKPIPSFILEIRKIKDDDEIKILKKASYYALKGFDYLLSILKTGITEKQASLELEIFWKKQGLSKTSFDPIIAFGQNTANPHHQPSKRKLKKGDIIQVDIGVSYKHYHSDMSRVIFFGKPKKELETIYSIVLKAQQNALSLCKPKALIGEIDKKARDIIKEHGYEKYFPHSLGHGIGIEIHELPIIRNRPPFATQTLEEGMVITIEPGIYIPNLGGVRIEDTIIITQSGHINLTKRKKYHLIEE